MKLQTIIISILLFSAAIVGSYSFITDLGSSYGVTVDQTRLNTLNQNNQLSTDINSTYTKIQGLTANTGSTFSIITFVPDILKIMIDMITLPFSILSDLLFNINTYLQLPGWMFTTILSIITVLLVLVIINAILRWDT